MRKLIVVFIVLSCTLNHVYAGTIEEGQQLLDKVFKRYEKLSKIDATKMHWLEYEAKTVLRDRSAATITDKVVLKYNLQRQHMMSSMVDLRKDKNEIFVVNKLSNQVLRANPEKENSTTNNSQLIFQNAEVIKKATVRQYEKVLGEQEYDKKITVVFSDTIARRLGVKTVEYYIQSKTLEIYRIKAKYHPVSRISEVSMTFLVRKWNVSLTLPNNVYRVFLNDQGQLKGKYASFDLIDKRN